MGRQEKIFRRSSTTYYYSSKIFPRKVRSDVNILYGFVRKADDMVDTIPQKREKFFNFREKTFSAIEGSGADDEIIEDFIDLYRRKEFEKEWIEAFLDSMERDLGESHYSTFEETRDYIHGSAEVIGLMMAQILELGEESHQKAKMMGRSMQYINFIRDIKEDKQLGRTYLPEEHWTEFGLEELSEEEANRKTEAFKNYIRAEIERYREMREEALEGMKHLPWRYELAVRTSSNLYRWTSERIQKEPLKVFEKEIKPGKTRIGFEALKALAA